MVDTIIQILPYRNFLITKPDNFIPSARDLHKNTALFMKFYNNPTAEDRRQKIYKPRMTLYKRGRIFELKVEYSAPKLLFKNNLQEVIENDAEPVAESLRRKMDEMGVKVTSTSLKEAAVTTFHPSKNIDIIGGYSAMGIIRDIAKINLTEKMDLDLKDYRNGGHCLQIYAETNALVFYAKVQDLLKSEKRSFGKDQKMQRASLFDFMEIIKQGTPPEILRMETRLNDRRKINSVMDKLGLPKNPTFSDLFKNQVCQKVMRYYFETFIEPNLFIFDLEETPQKILSSLLKNNPKMTAAKAIELTGLKMLCKDDNGVRGMRKILGRKAQGDNWTRTAQKIKELNKHSTIKNSYEYIQQIKTALQNFKPYALPENILPEPQRAKPINRNSDPMYWEH